MVTVIKDSIEEADKEEVLDVLVLRNTIGLEL
jgi:hypothetical protein